MKRIAALFTGVCVLVILVPILWVLLSSLKTGDQIVGHPWSLPTTPHWVNYVNAWQTAGIGRAFGNSLLVTLGTLALLLPSGAMAAYVLARYEFPGRGLLFGGFLGGMMFPHFLVIVPLFFLMKSLDLLDTRTGLTIVYVAYSLSFTVFVLTGFFQTLPKELGEAAMIDGAGHAGTFWQVMLPLAKPGLIVVGIFNAIGLWNEYGLALVLIPSAANQTLPLGIANLTMTQQYQSDWGALFAGLVIVMLPVVIVYAIFRDRIHETMLAGAVKG
ncbi:carbohydrate ABC transporter permease [Fimbriimonas ginsengisoli]|uniref:N-Acetyl-D-glucosamine ABC transport system, permease protein 2 n=1 Tax=Fimbriimonas ginsengisoli Gsoil 348 TaxID=661478 RepID=A0A068NMI9_FIMGI|nr:carbohydrate ABC transporter permease [Fimbriimonas ginsengisoli]AIE84788.1 N-Acetyl-D-glucosamine ABC transport system, permease protein 2 [Fimbriimonas ginsengisoli Gsoil 348]